MIILQYGNILLHPYFSHFFPENVDFWGKKHKKTANPL